MMDSKKRTITIVLAATLALSLLLCACGTGGDAPPAVDSSAPGVTDTQAPAPDDNPEPDNTPDESETPIPAPAAEGDLLAADLIPFFASQEPNIVGGFNRINLEIRGDVPFEFSDISNAVLYKDEQSISDTAVSNEFNKMDYNGDTLIFLGFSQDVATGGPGVYKLTFEYRGQMYCSSSFTWYEDGQPKGDSQYDYSTFGQIDAAPNAN